MNKFILIVEDYPETLSMLLTFLESEGYTVKAAESGEEALRLVSEQNFDIILLDIMLPRVDGFEVSRRIKSDSKTKDIPIIAITAFDVRNIKDKCYEAGINEIFLKPLDLPGLLEIIKKHVP